jgi:NADPH-dependent ferric siderophore reductase
MNAIHANIFRAAARVELAEPQIMLDRLCEYFTEYGEVTRDAGRCRIDTPYGAAILRAEGNVLTLEAEGNDETNFAYVKLAMAEHILALAAPQGPEIIWTGHGEAGTPLPYFREMTVISARMLTPHMRRITLQGHDLQRFATGGYHVRLLFPPKGTAPVWPVTGADGRPQWPDEASRPAVRIYTMRRIDTATGKVEIDMVLHDGADGPGARFAANARAGDIVGMLGPGGGSYEPADRYLIAGDETALPAIARMLEELPETAEADIFIEIADEAERQALRSRAKTRITWLFRDGAVAGSTALLRDAIAAHRPVQSDQRLFVWAGCEYDTFRAIKQTITQDWRLPKGDHLAVSYWRAHSTPCPG